MYAYREVTKITETHESILVKNGFFVSFVPFVSS